MRAPSTAALRTQLGLTPEVAKEAKHLLHASRVQLEATPAGAARVAECFNAPATSDLRMTCLDALIGTYGVEAFETRDGRWVSYLNAGDAYAPTLCRRPGGVYVIACWGAIAEKLAA